MNEITLELSILGPALLAGIIVLSTHVPLGILVLQRGIIFLDLTNRVITCCCTYWISCHCSSNHRTFLATLIS